MAIDLNKACCNSGSTFPGSFFSGFKHQDHSENIYVVVAEITQPPGKSNIKSAGGHAVLNNGDWLIYTTPCNIGVREIPRIFEKWVGNPPSFDRRTAWATLCGSRVDSASPRGSTE